MAAFFSVAVLFLSCTGAGAVALHALGMWRERDGFERAALAFALGFGITGWLMFWVGTAGYLEPVVIWTGAAVLAAGNLLHFRYPAVSARREPLDGAALVSLWLLAAFAAVAMFFDLVEALTPPADADTLAYHFTLPRRFMDEGVVSFVPVAFSGAIPLLVHMTYGAAYGLGGDAALPLWTFASGWMAAVMLFAFARRWLSLPWALLPAVLFQTLPAAVYGAGSGQVEMRLALFVLIAVIGLADGLRARSLSPLILAGLGAGFYAGGKLTGLLFVAAAGVAVVISGKDWFRRGLVFSVVAFAAGGQWYGWNFLNSGDPVFPLMFDLADRLGLANPDYWNADHASALKKYLAWRKEVVAGAHWWISYPFIATLAPPEAIESGRVGLGPYFLLIAPLAVLGAWKNRSTLFRSPLFPVAVAVIAFYLLWMQFGGIQKPRHLLPIIPALMICLHVAAVRGNFSVAAKPVALAGLLSLSINFAAHGLFSKNYLAHFFSGARAESFLEQNLRGFPVVSAVNAVPDVTFLYIWERQIQFYLKAPTFFSAPYSQALIDSRGGRVLPEKFYSQLRAQGISHLLLPQSQEDSDAKTVMTAAAKLSDRRCLSLIAKYPYSLFGSRTLKSTTLSIGHMYLWKVIPGCPLDKSSG